MPDDWLLLSDPDVSALETELVQAALRAPRLSAGRPVQSAVPQHVVFPQFGNLVKRFNQSSHRPIWSSSGKIWADPLHYGRSVERMGATD